MATSLVDECVKKFLDPVKKDGLMNMSSRLLDQIKKGLEKEEHDGEVKMLITYVHDLPDGKEEGQFLALDLGGSNFRVLKITISNGEIQQEDEKMVIDDATKKSDADTLFGFIAKCLAEFVQRKNITTKLPLGFTFSFPVHQTSLIAGTLIAWTKDFDAAGVVGEDVVQILHKCLKKRGDVDIDVVALVNDTTGTQMAIGHKDRDCHVGVILGTGTNACYTESLSEVKKFKGDRSKYDKVIINTEWGAFGDKGSLEPWITEFDRALDEQEQVKNKGLQLYEKMISGKYLGELVRHVLKKLISAGALFGGKSTVVFDTFELFETKFVSSIEEGDGKDVTQCRNILVKDCGLETVSDEDCHIVRRVCEAVSTRAARLAAAGIITIVKKIGKLDKCTVAIDGTLYKKHPQFRHRMKEAMDELAPGNGIEVKESEDGSGRGAAMVAAVAVRLAAEGEYNKS